jgi:uncharacterized protein (TIGR03083 family)
MEAPTTVTALLQHIHAERARLDALVLGLDDTALTAAGPGNGWSAKDILLHVAFWERRMAYALRAAKRGEDPWPDGGVEGGQETDRLNERAYEAARAMSASEARVLARESFAEAVAAISALADDDLHNPEGLTQALGEPTLTIIAENTYEHYEEHLPALEQMA